MTYRLKIKTYFDVDSWVVESEVSDSSDPSFPQDIFLWTLKKDGSLDEFQAIGHVDQIAKYGAYDSDRENNFGIHLVKYSRSFQRVPTEATRDDVVTVLKSAFNLLVTGFNKDSEPTEELYDGVVYAKVR